MKNKKKDKISVSFIGSGNVACHLARGFSNAGVLLKTIWSRNIESSKIIAGLTSSRAVKSIQEIDSNSDYYIIAVPDDAIKKVVEDLPDVKGMVLHTSGMTELDVLSSRFEKSGVFYPLQTFSKSKDVNLNEVPFCIESNNEEDLDELKRLALTLSDTVYEIDSEKRKYLHLAAVFVSNFVNYLYLTGEKILKEKEIPFTILHPLIKEVASKVLELSPEEAQTGPARRKDLITIEKHENLLKIINKDYLEIYKLLTGQIIKKYYEL